MPQPRPDAFDILQNEKSCFLRELIRIIRILKNGQEFQDIQLNLVEIQDEISILFPKKYLKSAISCNLGYPSFNKIFLLLPPWGGGSGTYWEHCYKGGNGGGDINKNITFNTGLNPPLLLVLNCRLKFAKVSWFGCWQVIYKLPSKAKLFTVYQ